MKLDYKKPKMVKEEFVANEYVAACYFVTCEGWVGTKRNTHGYYFTSYPFVTNKNNFNIGECPYPGCGKGDDDNQDYNTSQIYEEPKDIPYALTIKSIFSWNDDEMVHWVIGEHEENLTSTAVVS